MQFSLRISAIAVVAAAAMAMPALADTVVLDFEGVGDDVEIGNFYGPDYIFSDDAVAMESYYEVDGSGRFGHAPSGVTVMAFQYSNFAILNVSGGFTDGFSFYYSSSAAGMVTVWDGLDGTGNLLGSIAVTGQYRDGCEDDFILYCNWTAGGVDFTGTAHSINFGGAADSTAYDNITFGDRVPGEGSTIPGVPEPASWALLIAGFGLVGASIRRRKPRAAQA